MNVVMNKAWRIFVWLFIPKSWSSVLFGACFCIIAMSAVLGYRSGQLANTCSIDWRLAGVTQLVHDNIAVYTSMPSNGIPDLLSRIYMRGDTRRVDGDPQYYFENGSLIILPGSMASGLYLVDVSGAKYNFKVC